MDIGRLSRALEAESLAKAWRIVHDPKADLKTKAPYQGDVVRLKELLRDG